MADMLGFIQQATKPLTGYWHSQTASRKRLLVTLAVLLIGIAGFLSWFINRSHYEVLYTGLSTSEAGAILQQLSDRKVDARPQGSDTILVPREQVDALRMDLAASGYPKSGDSLEILQQGTGFGMTESHQLLSPCGDCNLPN